MGEQDNGLNLQGLAQKLQALERENERMRSENAELQHKVTTLEGSAQSLPVNRYLEVNELGASELDERQVVLGFLLSTRRAGPRDGNLGAKGGRSG